jgi:hypothetical protein
LNHNPRSVVLVEGHYLVPMVRTSLEKRTN